MISRTTFIAMVGSLLILLPAMGCASRRGTSDFMKTINSIRPGTPMSVVRDELGKPHDTREGVMAVNPPPGPTQVLVGRVPTGAPYRHWIYKGGESHYHVFFAQTTVQSGDRWEVVHVRSTPATEVY